MFLIMLHYHLMFLLTKHKCALTSVFLETCSPVNILGHFRQTETHTVYISYNPSYVTSSLYWFPPIKPYHTPYFIFMNNNNLPLLHAANDNKLF